MTWQDPYGRPGGQGGWQNPYNQPGYGYGYGPPGGPPRASNGPAIGALIANIVAAVFCCGGLAWLPGVILAAVAINRTPQDPESARRLTTWAWVCLALDVVLTVALAVILYAIGAFETRNA